MDKNTTFKQVFFLGIGGIGMSALARYFKSKNYPVCGYDKTPSNLTADLIKEGIEVFYEDNPNLIPPLYTNNPLETLWIFTPAIPKNAQILALPYIWKKRSQVLGIISKDSNCLAVAGTHGKTTTSVLLAHLLHTANINFTAFLGGISANLGSNYFSYTSGTSPLAKDITIMEADEFDRSFLQLNPYHAIITSNDPDHLDIYETKEAFEQAFKEFAELVENTLFISDKVHLNTQKLNAISYSLNLNTDVKAEIVKMSDGKMVFNYLSKNHTITNIEMGVPGLHNLENTLAAMSMALAVNADASLVKKGVESFLGVARRFQFIYKTKTHVVIDDYAHHPTEIKSCVSAVKALYPNVPIIGIFQPHLFSRTKDFADEFAIELAKLDELILMDIYPARELPIKGVNSEWLLNKVNLSNKKLLNANEIFEQISLSKPPVLLILGAGDIDRIVPKIKEIYETA